ncbi:MAG: beta-lactamase family protein [Phycisphaerales bacterium]|nr:MAG: beta-lactamase family protein [Phycisphaerales bacterium]
MSQRAQLTNLVPFWICLLCLLPAAPGEAQLTKGKAGVDPAGQIEAILAAFHERAGFPGATIGYVLPDRTAGSVSVGVAFKKTGRAMTGDDRMMAGSTGKTFFAALALQLVDEDVLALDEKISTWLGDEEWFERLPNARDITLRMLLNHTSGIPRYVMLEDFVEAMIENPNRRWEPAELLAFVFDHEPLFTVGEGWSYADTNFIVLGAIIEKVTGDSCYNQIYRRILRPHGLWDIVPTTSRDVLGLAGGYIDPDGNLFQLEEENVVKGGRFVFNPQFEWGGGGFASTPGELARWAKLLYAGDVLSAKMRKEMRNSVEAQLGPGSRYGLGMMERPSEVGTVIGHGGYFPGYLTNMSYYVEHDLALAIQINTTKMSEALNYAAMMEALDKCAATLVHGSKPADADE